MNEPAIGDIVAVEVTPAFGKPRIRNGTVFAVTDDIVTVEVEAPGEPDWPYTVRATGTGPFPSGKIDEGDVLQPGDHGEAVTALQTDLSALGFAITINGVFDDETRVRLEQFQTALGMVPHGFATKATRDRLTELVRCNRAEH